MKKLLFLLGFIPSLAFSSGIFNPGSGGGGGGASSLAIDDEGVQISSPTGTLNFVGAGVTVTAQGTSSATITIPGSAGGGMTLGSTDYVWISTGTLQPGGFYVSSGTVMGPFGVYPNADTGNYMLLTVRNGSEPDFKWRVGGGGGDTANWRIFDFADVQRFGFRGLGSNGGFSISASTSSDMTAVSRIRLSDNNDAATILFNEGVDGGFETSIGSMTFNSGDRDPKFDYTKDGIFKVISSTIDLRNATILVSSITGLTGSFGISFEGNGSAIVVGSTKAFVMPYDCTITSFTFTSGISAGSISIRVSSATAANYKALGGAALTSIVGGGNMPSIVSGYYNSETVSGWDQVAITKGTVIGFVVESAATSTWANLIMEVTK